MTLNHQKNEEVKPLNIHKIFPSSFSSTSLSIIPSKKFPIRGRMVQKRFKRASSTNDLSENLSETSKNKKANLSHVFNPYFRMKESMISKEEKMKTETTQKEVKGITLIALVILPISFNLVFFLILYHVLYMLLIIPH